MEQESNLDCLIDSFEQPENLSDKEIFTKIWTSPRKIFKYIVDRNYKKYVVILLILSGISHAFSQAIDKGMGDKLPIIPIILICIIGGGLFGWLSFYIAAILLSWTGKWLKGKGTTDSILTIISYAMIPSIVAMVLLIPQICIFGADLFKANSDLEGASALSLILLLITGVLQIILAIWTFVLWIIGISEVQKFSIGKSILNMLVPGLLLLAIVLPLVLLINSLK